MKTYKYSNVVRTISTPYFLLIDQVDISGLQEYSIILHPTKGTWSRHGAHFNVCSIYGPMHVCWLLSNNGYEVRDLILNFGGSLADRERALAYLAAEYLLANGDTSEIRSAAARLRADLAWCISL